MGLRGHDTDCTKCSLAASLRIDLSVPCTRKPAYLFVNPACPSSRDTHHHFNLDLGFRLIERLDANRRDAGHRVREQLT